MSIVHSCVQDLVDFSLIPYSGWNWDTARDPIGKPAIAKWNVELRNIAGVCVCVCVCECVCVSVCVCECVCVCVCV